jgi:hypothetical protein
LRVLVYISEEGFYVNNNPLLYTDPSGNWIETAFDLLSLGMTLNDIRNEGMTGMNALMLVTDVVSVVLPIVPAGVSHALRAAKIANKLANTADMAADTIKTVDKVSDTAKNIFKNDVDEIYNDAVKNADSPLAVLGTTRDKYDKIAAGWGSTHLYTNKYDDFVSKYGAGAFWDYVNKPYVQKEIINKKKNVMFTTSIDVVKERLQKSSSTYKEYEMLLKAGYLRKGKNVMFAPR